MGSQIDARAQIKMSVKSNVELEQNKKDNVSSIFPIFFAFYLGAWADLFGRKLLLLLFFIAYFLQAIIELVCAYYEDSKKEFLLIAGAPFTLVGEYYSSN